MKPDFRCPMLSVASEGVWPWNKGKSDPCNKAPGDFLFERGVLCFSGSVYKSGSVFVMETIKIIHYPGLLVFFPITFTLFVIS